MSLASLKRRLTVGTKITMTSHSWYPNGALIGVAREVVEVGKTFIRLSLPGKDSTSSLYWPPARRVLFNDSDNKFTVCLDDSCEDRPAMTYEISEEKL